jgi:hypothetical protein
MAGAYDRDIVIPKATAPIAPDTYVDPIQRKTELNAIQKEYIDTRSTTRVTLEGQKTTLQDLAKRANEIKDPAERADFIQGVKDGLANVKLGLELQAIIDANDNANAGASDKAKNLLKSDAIFVAEGTSGISNTGKYYLDGVEVSKETYAGGGSGPTGTGGSGGSGGTGSNPLSNASGSGAVSNERRDAFAAITTTLKTYGFTDAEMLELEKYISNVLINPSIGPNQALLDMRQLGAYKARFAGNETRVKSGLNALSESDYLAQEDSYGQYMKAYGVPDLGNRIQYASLIAGDVSATELNKRLDLAVTRVKKSDPEIFRLLHNYYGISETDMVKYVLKPTEMLPELQRKVTSAEIGAAFIGQGLTSNRMASESYAAYGIDRAGALQGAASIAAVLPEATKLGNVYSETGIQYNQQTGEEEFLMSSDAAKRKRNILASKERASFDGSAGNAPGAYSTSYLKRNSSAGQI